MDDGSRSPPHGQAETRARRRRGGRRLAIGIALSSAIHLVLLGIALRGCGEAPAERVRTIVVAAVERLHEPPTVEPREPAPRAAHRGRSGAGPSRSHRKRPAPRPEERAPSAGEAAQPVAEAETLPPPAEAEPAPPTVVPSPRQVALSLLLSENENAELERRLDHDLSGMLARQGGGAADGRGGDGCFRHEGHWWCPPGHGGGGGGRLRTEALKVGVDLYCW